MEYLRRWFLVWSGAANAGAALGGGLRLAQGLPYPAWIVVGNCVALVGCVIFWVRRISK
jgi:hypothetical protein